MSKITRCLNVKEEEIDKIAIRIMKVRNKFENNNLDKNLMEYIKERYGNNPDKLIIATVICGMISETLYNNFADEIENRFK